MSYGQPWSRITTGPLAGPASAYPTLSTPASICFSGPNDPPPPAPVVRAGFAAAATGSPCAKSITPSRDAATAVAIPARKRRRPRLRSRFMARLLAEGERERLDSGIEKLDHQGVIFDGA